MEIPEAEEPPVRLHPRWRSPSLVVPLLMGGPLVLALGFAERSAIGGYAGFFLILYSARAAILMNRGFTEAWPDGLYNRLTGRRAAVAWERVERLVVEPTLFGRYVQVEERDGERITLAAPRAGLIADGRQFEADLARLRAMASGGRAMPPLHSASRAPAVILQLLLLSGIIGAVATAIVR